ncbi:lantibiotic dehydratase [Olivibacter jilunii]|uniref:lantibiotic dehydratase n=1 Tax=Olivibacter jilunii TaxID=985016 RepID=UPI003F15BD25
MDNKIGQSVPTLFPHVLVRVANGNPNRFPVTDGQIAQIAKELETIDGELAQLRAHICDELFTFIPAYRDDDRFQSLIQLKRDIFNARALSVNQWALLEILPGRIRTAVENLDERVKDRAERYTLYQRVYKRIINTFEASLQGLTKEADFRKALLLSSEALLSKLLQASEQDCSMSGNGQQKRLFFSLLRYTSRKFFKPSPFSLFTAIGVLSLKEETAPLLFAVSAKGKVDSHVRINSSLLGYLCHLLLTLPKVRKSIPLRCNDTARVKDGYVHFVELSEQSEAVKRIKYTPLLAKILECLQHNPNFYALRETLTFEIGSADEAQIDILLEKLLESGLIHYHWGDKGISDRWPVDLIAKLQAIPAQDETLSVLSFLSCLMEAKDNYPEADVRQRQSLLHLCTAAWKQMVTAFGAEAELYRGKPPAFLYEDAFVPIEGKIDKKAVQKLAVLLEELAAFLRPIDALQTERERIKTHFIQLTDGKADAEVDLLSFYLSYRQVYPSHRDVNEALENDTFSEAHQSRYRTVLEEIKALPAFRQLQKGQETLNIDRLQNLYIREQLPSVRSRAAFLQFFADNERHTLCGVVNAVFQGMGKGQGRFLYLLDRQLTTDLRNYNARVLGDRLGMELADASRFNANQHPPLLNHVLGWEGGQHGYGKRQEINVNDLLLVWDTVTENPVLIHRESRMQVLPFDLSLQAISRRASLYRFLVHFSSEQALSFRPFALALDEVVAGLYETENFSVRLLPRLVYGDSLVIRRRAWLVSVDALPKRAQEEDDDQLFLHYRRFFDSWKMPQRLFLKLKPRKVGAPSGDEYKPQYLDTYLPPFVLLLERLLPKADKHIYFEEFLPDALDENSQQVTECLMQWYN